MSFIANTLNGIVSAIVDMPMLSKALLIGVVIMGYFAWQLYKEYEYQQTTDDPKVEWRKKYFR